MYQIHRLDEIYRFRRPRIFFREKLRKSVATQFETLWNHQKLKRAITRHGYVRFQWNLYQIHRLDEIYRFRRSRQFWLTKQLFSKSTHVNSKTSKISNLHNSTRLSPFSMTPVPKWSAQRGTSFWTIDRTKNNENK